MKTLSGVMYEAGTSQSIRATRFNVVFSKRSHLKENYIKNTKQISNHYLITGVVLSHIKAKKRRHRNSNYKTEFRKK
jgi:hypothetical protein